MFVNTNHRCVVHCLANCFTPKEEKKKKRRKKEEKKVLGEKIKKPQKPQKLNPIVLLFYLVCSYNAFHCFVSIRTVIDHSLLIFFRLVCSTTPKHNLPHLFVYLI